MLVGSAFAGTNPCPGGGELLDQKNGFREVKLGSKFATFAGMHPTEQEQYKTKTVRAYERTGDRLEVFGQPLSHIIYYFFNDQLFLVRLEWCEKANGIEILHGFATALRCPPRSVVVGPANGTELHVQGNSVDLLGKHFAVAHAATGWVEFERVGAAEAIRVQVQREAGAQF